MTDWHWLLSKVVTLATRTTAPRSTTVTVLVTAVLVILGITLVLFFSLIVLRLTGSWRERRTLAKKEDLSPLVYDLLTEERSMQDLVASLESVVPKRDHGVLEQVLLENIRFLKGSEQEILTGAFDKLGFVDEDITNLGKRGMVRQAESAYHLGMMRSERAVPALAAALESTSRPEVTFSCLNSLSKIGTSEALDTVVKHLAASPELETLRVAEVLLERKQEFSGYLERWMERGEPDTDRLILLVNIVGAMKDTNAVPLLLRFLKHDDPRVRARAAFSLGTIGDFVVCDDLEAAMDDVDAEVRAESAEALGKLQCGSSIPRLEQGLYDEVLAVKINCAVALAQIGEDGRAILEKDLHSASDVASEVLETFEIRDKEDRGGS